jgi:signal peptidase I
MSRRQVLQTAATVAFLLGLGVVVCFATGFVSIVTTHGTSMLPRFHTGDLAVVWAVGGYHPGQVVAYRSPMLHTLVLHRVVAYHGGLYSFKGDNNSFVDPLRLPSSAIRGSLLLHLPHLGLVYNWLRSPLHLVIIGLLLLVLVGGSAPPVRQRAVRQRAVRQRAGRPSEHRGGASATVGLTVPGRSALTALVAIVFAGMAVFAWARPDHRPVSEPRAYQQQARFSYSAAAPPSLVYPDAIARTGQPLFLDLVHRLDVSTHLRFSSAYPSRVITGKATVAALLVSGNGWTVTLDKAAPVAFSSSQVTVDLWVDLRRLTADVEAADKETGVEAAQPELVVAASVAFRVIVDGKPVLASYSPSLSFDVVGPELVLQAQPSSAGPAGTAQLAQSKSGSVYVAGTKPATVRILRYSLSVDDLRGAGSLGAIVCALLATLMAFWDLRRGRTGDLAEIEARYRPDLVAVSTSPEGPAKTLVDVVEMASLAKLAETYGTVILVHEHGADHSYYVDSGARSLYRYRAAAPAAHERRSPRERAYEPRHSAHGDGPATRGQGAPAPVRGSPVRGSPVRGSPVRGSVRLLQARRRLSGAVSVQGPVEVPEA